MAHAGYESIGILRLVAQKCRTDFTGFLLFSFLHLLNHSLLGAPSTTWASTFSPATRSNTSGSVVLGTLVLRRAANRRCILPSASQANTRLSLCSPLAITLPPLPSPQSRRLTIHAPCIITTNIGYFIFTLASPITSQGLGFGPLAQGGVARFFGNKNTQYVLVFVVTNEIKH